MAADSISYIIPCSWRRAQLNERLAWKGGAVRPAHISSIAALRPFRSCPDLWSAAVLSEAAGILNQFVPRVSRNHRIFNLTNTSQWKVLANEARQWLQWGEKHLRRLMMEEHLVYHYHPAHWSSAPFFRATSFVKAAQRASPLLTSELKLRTLPRHERDWWRALELQLPSDMAMQMPRRSTLRNDASPTSPTSPCTLDRALSDLLEVEDLRFQASPTWDDAAGLRIRWLLHSAQSSLACIKGDEGIAGSPRLLHHFMFRGSHLFFSLLDRLDCRIWAALNTQQRPSPFWMRLLPSPFTEANSVRGRRKFHCDSEFQDLLKELRASELASASGSRFRFVEVGASLGGCTFHVLTSVPSAVAVAVEPFQPTAEAMKQTAAWNGLAERLTVQQTFVSEREGACRISSLQNIYETRSPHWDFGQEDSSDGTATNCASATLEQILTSAWGDFGTLDVLRVHVDGWEETVLKSLGDRLRPPWVRAVALAMWRSREPRAGHVYDPVAIADLLRSRGYDLLLTPTLEKGPLRNEDVVLALRRGVQAAGIMTLIATGPALQVPERNKLPGIGSLQVKAQMS